METEWVNIEVESGYPFSREFSVTSSQVLTEIIGIDFFSDEKNRYHDLYQKWKIRSKSSNLLFNLLAIDVSFLRNIPGFDCVLHDLRNKKSYEGALHTIRSAAMFLRGEVHLKEFFESKNSKIPDYSMIFSNQEILVETKFLQESIFSKNFYKYAPELHNEIEKKCPYLTGFPAHISVVIKNSEHLPDFSMVTDAVEEIVKILNNNPGVITKDRVNTITKSYKYFNIIAIDKEEESKYWNEYRCISVYCARNPKENLKLLKIVKEANGQIGEKSQKNIPGLLIVGIGKHQDPHIIDFVISKEFKKYNFKNISKVMLIRTNYIVREDYTNVDDEIGFITNNNSYQNIGNISFVPIGGSRSMFENPPRNEVSAYEDSSVSGKIKNVQSEARLTLPLVTGLQR